MLLHTDFTLQKLPADQSAPVPVSSHGSAWSPVAAPVMMTPSERKNSEARAVSFIVTSAVRAWELQTHRQQAEQQTAMTHFWPTELDNSWDIRISNYCTDTYLSCFNVGKVYTVNCIWLNDQCITWLVMLILTHSIKVSLSQTFETHLVVYTHCFYYLSQRNLTIFTFWT